jgi:hypothetical protein
LDPGYVLIRLEEKRQQSTLHILGWNSEEVEANNQKDSQPLNHGHFASRQWKGLTPIFKI